MSTAEQRLSSLESKLAAGDLTAVINDAEAMIADGVCPRGLHYTRAAAYFKGNAILPALHAVEGELALHPDHEAARKLFDEIDAKLGPRLSDLPAQRAWSTQLDQNMIQYFEHAAQRYTYKGVPMIKNAFDLAIYPRLLWDIKPRTILEIGSYYGGSALWMADLMRGYGVQTKIYSVDVRRVTTAADRDVEFIVGSGRDLASVFTDAQLAAMPRPWLVIEDADHSYETTTAVLHYFHDRLHDGERIIVEDVITSPPAAKGLMEFLASHGTGYRVERQYCDYFGNNVTWCVNGFLRRQR
jgi:cephalosporin hydroxylase